MKKKTPKPIVIPPTINEKDQKRFSDYLKQQTKGTREHKELLDEIGSLSSKLLSNDEEKSVLL